MTVTQEYPDQFRCLVVDKQDEQVSFGVEQRSLDTVPPADVTIRVRYSSLNYKDGLCSTAHPGIARTLPLIPGIDAAGTVVQSEAADFSVGDEVMVFHEAFGTSANGGYAEYVRVPADWVYRVPQGLTMRQSMIYGTAGFTAAQSVQELERHGVKPESGEVIVTGATGGVGIFAVKLLGKLGFEVVAVTGKPEQTEWLKNNGARQVISRRECNDLSDRPLLSGRWAGAVDTVGGNTLATLLRSTRRFGCVTACGLVGGVELPITVYPFILRGVTLQGIDTAGISRDRRNAIWNRLATDWAVPGLDELASEVELEEMPMRVKEILGGRVVGRVVVKL